MEAVNGGGDAADHTIARETARSIVRSAPGSVGPGALISPELALVDPALRVRLLGEMSAELRVDRATPPVGFSALTGIAPPPEGAETGRGAFGVDVEKVRLLVAALVGAGVTLVAVYGLGVADPKPGLGSVGVSGRTAAAPPQEVTVTVASSTPAKSFVPPPELAPNGLRVVPRLVTPPPVTPRPVTPRPVTPAPSASRVVTTEPSTRPVVTPAPSTRRVGTRASTVPRRGTAPRAGLPRPRSRPGVRPRPASAGTVAPPVPTHVAPPRVKTPEVPPRRVTHPRGAPPTGAPVRAEPAPVSVREFAWAPVSGATSYEVEMLQGHTTVYRSYTTKPMIRIAVRARGSATSSRGSVGPGTYEWYVWPLTNGHRRALPIVRSRLVLVGG